MAIKGTGVDKILNREWLRRRTSRLNSTLRPRTTRRNHIVIGLIAFRPTKSQPRGFFHPLGRSTRLVPVASSHVLLSSCPWSSPFSTDFFCSFRWKMSNVSQNFSPKQCFELFKNSPMNQPEKVLQGSHKFLLNSLKGKLEDPTVDSVKWPLHEF